MPSQVSPGEHAYAAYWQRLAQPPATILLTRLAWGEIYPEERAAWEAAAQAVVDAWQAQPALKTPTQKEPAHG